MEYDISLASSAEKEINSLPKNIQERVEKAIDLLKDIPRPPGTIKIKGKEDLYRIRKGDYRIIYSIDDENHIIDICYMRHRSKAYKF